MYDTRDYYRSENNHHMRKWSQCEIIIATELLKNNDIDVNDFHGLKIKD